MKSFKTYQGVELPKNQASVANLIESGSDDWINSYYITSKRCAKGLVHPRQIASWFNRQLKRLHNKGLFEDVPFIAVNIDDPEAYTWKNPYKK